MSFGDRLKLLREKTGLTQKFVADKIGVKNNTLSSYEAGKRQPDYLILQKLADLYEVSVDYLLTGKEKEVSSEEVLEDPDFQHAMRSAQGFSEENKKKVLEYIELIGQLEKGRKPGDRQPRRKK